MAQPLRAANAPAVPRDVGEAIVDPPVNRVFAATTGTERQIVIGGFGLAKHLELESLSGLP